eukprot:TRINITY_DN17178_c0_g1_i1.p1 TRINITY_DN17178_c0_g1~~TRINITY_DN17178_c0_g1_i1.p1  ORF type:complete len:126 (-),score=28.78 TRINITY_DN17178_c0_g1_i1:248-625(-)
MDILTRWINYHLNKNEMASIDDLVNNLSSEKLFEIICTMVLLLCKNAEFEEISFTENFIKNNILKPIAKIGIPPIFDHKLLMHKTKNTKKEIYILLHSHLLHFKTKLPINEELNRIDQQLVNRHK